MAAATDGVVFEAAEGVLVEGEAALDGALAEGDVVHLGAGEVLQGGSVAGAREEADVDLEVVAEGEGDFVLAFGEELVDEGQGWLRARRRRRRRRARRRGR